MSAAFDPNTLHQHARALYALALRKVRDPMLAEDLVQDTFVAVLSDGGARFAGRSSLRTWLTGILKHKIADAFRERAKAPVSYEEWAHIETDDPIIFEGEGATPTDAAPRPHGYDPGPEAAIERKRFLEACQGELNRLSAQRAQAFVLSEVLGHDTQEVCAQLGISSANLWTSLHRTRQSLRGALQELRPA